MGLFGFGKKNGDGIFLKMQKKQKTEEKQSES